MANLIAAQPEVDRRYNEGRDAAIGEINMGQAQADSAIKNGFDAAQGAYGMAQKAFEPYTTAGLSAWNAYNDAAGVNGADGSARATANFRASPGYAWQVDQATDAAARKASSLGMLGSGNTASAITTLASNLADQEYGNYKAGLKSSSDQGYAANTAVAGLVKGAGDLSAQEGTTLASLYQGDAARKATVQQQTGAATANSYQQFGQGLANINYQKGKDLQAASGNLWGALIGAGTALATGGGSLLGGGGGSGGLGGLVSSFLGGGSSGSAGSSNLAGGGVASTTPTYVAPSFLSASPSTSFYGNSGGYSSLANQLANVRDVNKLYFGTSV